jgi:hypothetical protein
MKNIKILSLLLSVGLAAVSCDKNEIEYGAVPTTGKAEFQLHNFVPLPTTATAQTTIYPVVLNDKAITNNTLTLVPYNAVPNQVGVFFVTEPGQNNLKLYVRSKNTPVTDSLVYDQNVALNAKRQNVVVYDYSKPPIVFDTESPFVSDSKSYATDTIGYIKFYNLLFEDVNTPTTLKLQYQYQQDLVHPRYTIYDQLKGTIPEGKKVGDTTGDTTKGPWVNMGNPVGFGECTGWCVVPVHPNAWLASVPTARINLRLVVVEGGVLGVNMDANGLLLVKGSAFSDYWSIGIGRRYHQFLSGARDTGPTAEIRQFGAL